MGTDITCNLFPCGEIDIRNKKPPQAAGPMLFCGGKMQSIIQLISDTYLSNS